ncbi:MAG: hypothetical protein GIKADHBN_02472 [Phycisphaerales bacterium]|nr:hypothetical protein [Phycisphaerales bacterium]
MVLHHMRARGHSRTATARAARLTAPYLVAIAAAIASSQEQAQADLITVTFDAKGNISKDGKAVTQAIVEVYGANASGAWTWERDKSAANTDKDGMYSLMPTFKTNEYTGKKVFAMVRAKKITRDKGTTTVSSGQIGPKFYDSPGNNGTLDLTSSDIDLSQTVSYKTPQEYAFLKKSGVWIDPGYRYRVSDPIAHTGQITFTHDVALGDGPIAVNGIIDYRDGSAASLNEFDLDGNPITESFLGTSLSIDPINVLGLDDSGHAIMSGGAVRIEDDLGNSYLNGSLSNIVAGVESGEPVFHATIGNLTLGSTGLGSRLINEWTQDYLNGLELKVYFDASLLSASGMFASDADVQGYVAFATIPAPGPSVLALAGLCILGRRRRA